MDEGPTLWMSSCQDVGWVTWMSAVLVSKCSIRGQSRIKGGDSCQASFPLLFSPRVSTVCPAGLLGLKWYCTRESGNIHMREAGMSGTGVGGALKLAATYKGPQAERSSSVTLSWHFRVLPAFTSKGTALSLVGNEQALSGRRTEGVKLLLLCSVWWGMIIGGGMFAITWTEQLLWTAVFMGTDFCHIKPFLLITRWKWESTHFFPDKKRLIVFCSNYTWSLQKIRAMQKEQSIF